MILIGRVCASPKVRDYRCKDGHMICFDVATSQDGDNQVAGRHHVVVKDSPQENLATRFKSLFTAGRVLFIRGQLHHRNFVDRDLRAIEITEVVAQSINEIAPYMPKTNAVSMGVDHGR